MTNFNEQFTPLNTAMLVDSILTEACQNLSRLKDNLIVFLLTIDKNKNKAGQNLMALIFDSFTAFCRLETIINI